MLLTPEDLTENHIEIDFPRYGLIYSQLAYTRSTHSARVYNSNEGCWLYISIMVKKLCKSKSKLVPLYHPDGIRVLEAE